MLSTKKQRFHLKQINLIQTKSNSAGNASLDDFSHREKHEKVQDLDVLLHLEMRHYFIFSTKYFSEHQ